MKMKEYILGGYKNFGISFPKFLWQVIFIIPVQITRFLFCFMIAVFYLQIDMFFEAWKQTR